MLVGIFLRHFKIYSGARYISFGSKKLEKFNLFIGQNGVGKSSILEALDCFFNSSEFIVNSNEKKTDAFIAPCFLIPMNNVEKFDKDVQKIIPIISAELFKLQKSKSSNYDYYADFFIQKDNLLETFRETHYLVAFSEFPYRDTYKEENFFFTFDNIIKSAIKL